METIATDIAKLGSGTTGRSMIGTAMKAKSAPSRSAIYQDNLSENSALLRPGDHDVADTANNRDKINSALTAIDRIKAGANSRYEIRVDRGSGKIQIHLIDHTSGEVVEKIPSSRLLEFYGSLEELSGFLLERQA